MDKTVIFTIRQDCYVNGTKAYSITTENGDYGWYEAAVTDKHLFEQMEKITSTINNLKDNPAGVLFEVE